MTVDFLMPPADGQTGSLRVQNLEPDFGALVTPGLQLAFDEQVEVELEGRTLRGERTRRIVPVCGPAAFVALKALAFGDRAEPKDAFDLVYVIRHTKGRGAAIANGLTQHAERNAATVSHALAILARDFDTPDGIGPKRAAEFSVIDPRQLDNEAADAHGFVDDLLRAAGT